MVSRGAEIKSTSAECEEDFFTSSVDGTNTLLLRGRAKSDLRRAADNRVGAGIETLVLGLFSILDHDARPYGDERSRVLQSALPLATTVKAWA